MNKKHCQYIGRNLQENHILKTAEKLRSIRRNGMKKYIKRGQIIGQIINYANSCDIYSYAKLIISLQP